MQTKSSVPIELFKPGLYRHYKGAYYRALVIASHHETGEPLVAYISQDHIESGVRLREWCTEGTDSWRDEVEVVVSSDNHSWLPGDCEIGDRVTVPRFRWVGP